MTTRTIGRWLVAGAAALVVACGLVTASSAHAGLPARRWQVNAASGTVLDKWTGLLWQRQPPTTGGSGSTTEGRYTWADAKQYCQDLVLAGYDDWRLPWLQELRGLVDRKRSSPAISPFAFPNTPTSGSSYYWSATPYRSGSSSAWYVRFNTGTVDVNAVSSDYRVRCVR